MDQIEDYILNFLARKETSEDVENLKKWLANDPSHREDLKKLLIAWDSAKLINASEKIDAKKAYERFEARIAENKPSGKVVTLRTNSIFKTVMRIAAIFVSVFLLGIVGYYFFTKNIDNSSEVFTEIIVPLGSLDEIELPDGSLVMLNAGSSLRYPSDYGKKNRNVYFSGEGYFKVATINSKSAFNVNTYDAKIVVTGTEFNVRAYLDEETMETTLIKGAVFVEKEGIEPVLLQPGQKLSAKANEIEVIQLDLEKAKAETSWSKPDWRIEGMTLQNLALRLNKRFDVNIQVNEQVKDVHFTGTFKDETLEEILWIIKTSTDISYRIEGGEAFLE